ncbi:MAG TPA: hypothetical protein VJ647_05810 [Chitinophagaceae bacterium]|nr:hypothetical protein [Chitinophagaceae bacterium]
MKKLLIIIILFAGVAIEASAQKFVPRGGVRHYAPRPRVSVGVGIGAPWGWYGPGYPYYGYGAPYYWGDPYYNGWGYGRPSKLSLEIADIQNDYQARIWEVRHDKSIPRKERKKEIRQLKAQRDREVIEAKRRYYRD